MTRPNVIDLNADIGELCGYDDVIITHISSANIACGGHIGSLASMAAAVDLAILHKVRIGAHPSYPDKQHFGRVSFPIDESTLKQSLRSQIMSLETICQNKKCQLFHVKPHGALYNEAAKDEALAQLIVDVIKEINPTLWLMGLAGSALTDVGKRNGLKVIEEAFADRRYLSRLELAPRTLAGAVIHSGPEVIKQVLDIVLAQHITGINGDIIPLSADSICLHGDNPAAVALAHDIQQALTTHHITITSPTE